MRRFLNTVSSECYSFFLEKRSFVLKLSALMLVFLTLMPFVTTRRTDVSSSYTDKNDVALYIMQHHELPPNYITKGGFEYVQEKNIPYGDYTAIGGDTFINDGKLKNYGIGKNIGLRECDVVSKGYKIDSARGAERLVYTSNTKNVRVFYTDDHYKSFEEITYFELQIARNIFLIILGVYITACVIFYASVLVRAKDDLALFFGRRGTKYN